MHPTIIIKALVLKILDELSTSTTTTTTTTNHLAPSLKLV